MTFFQDQILPWNDKLKIMNSEGHEKNLPRPIFLDYATISIERGNCGSRPRCESGTSVLLKQVF
jgi:hypothetical protein